MALELKSEHPLAKAIVVYGEEQKIAMTAADEFQVMPGNGYLKVNAVKDLCVLHVDY